MTRFELMVLRDGAPVGALDVPIGAVPTVSFTASAEIKRTLSVECLPDSRFDWLRDKVQVMQITNGAEIPRGRFCITTAPAETDADGQKRVKLTGYDNGYTVKQLAKLETGLVLAAGTNVTEAVSAQLMAAGILKMQVERSAEVLLTDHDFEAGTSRYEIIKQLLEEINYRDLWFDGKGVAIAQAWQPCTIDRAVHHYDTGDKSALLAEMTDENDTFDAANVFISIVASADIAEDMVATAVNDNPLSALSVTRRGLRVPEVEILDSTTSQAELDSRVKIRLMQSMMGGRQITFTTIVDKDTANHGLNDGMIFEREEIGLLEEQDWQLQCVPGGTFTHTGRKVYYNAY